MAEAKATAVKSQGTFRLEVGLRKNEFELTSTP